MKCLYRKTQSQKRDARKNFGVEVFKQIKLNKFYKFIQKIALNQDPKWNANNAQCVLEKLSKQYETN